MAVARPMRFTLTSRPAGLKESKGLSRERAVYPARVMLACLALVLWSARPLRGQGLAKLDLDFPDRLAVGQTYEVTFKVSATREVRDAYVKLSLPEAFRVIAGKNWFRGALAVGAEVGLRVAFEVVGSPSGPVMGRFVAYAPSGEPAWGQARIRYPHPADGLFFMSTERAELVLEKRVADRSAEIEGTGRLARREQDLVRERFIVRENLAGPQFQGQTAAAQPVPQDRPLEGWLEAGAIKAYQFAGRRGDRIWITAHSETLDLRLLLVSPNGVVVAEDDDGTGGLDPRIPDEGVFELSYDGLYTVLLSSVRQDEAGAFRLQVQNFTRQEPQNTLPAADGPSVPSNPRAVTSGTTLIGRLVYNSPDGGTAPVRHAMVKLFADLPLAADPDLGTTETDETGRFSLRVPDANLGDVLYIRVSTRDVATKIGAVLDPLFGLHSAESFHFKLPSASTVDFGTWNVASVGMNSEFVVFDALVEGYLVASQIARLNPPPGKVYYPVRNLLSLFPKPGDIDAHYDPRNREIYLADLYGDSPDAVLHEYGHFLADVAGFLAPAGGNHSWPYCQRIDPGLAWNEGWATFFAVAGQNARGKPAKRTYVSRHPNNFFNYSLEDGHNKAIICEEAAGDQNEGSVQFILWDLYDDGQDWLSTAGAWDRVSLWSRDRGTFSLQRGVALPPASRAALIAGETLAFSDVLDLERFYDGLFQQFVFTPEQVAAMRAVFADQKIQWETPPAAPTNLRFVSSAGGVELQWQAGSPNTAGFLVQRKLPGEAAFTSVGAPRVGSYAIGNVPAGTLFRVIAVSFNTARYTAPLFSAPSQEVVYQGPPAGGTFAIRLSQSELVFTFEVGGRLPDSQTVVVTNAGAGTLVWTASTNVPWINISPTSGATPATVSVTVRPGDLLPGTHTGSITFSSPGVTAQVIQVVLRITPPTPIITAIVNAASFQPGMVPGGLASLFGKNLSTVSGLELPGGATSWKGTWVSVEGRQVPLLAISRTGEQEQINFQVPFELGAPASVTVVVSNNGATTTLRNVPLLRVQPGLFEWVPPGSPRYAAAVKLDGSVVGPGNPVARGEAVMLFLTGMGPVIPVVPTGQPGPVSPLAETWLKPTVLIGGVPAQVLFSGYAPGFLGLYQVNVVIPDGAPAGAARLEVLVEGVPSQPSLILLR